eukprot:4959810-Amphidinium_carterae.2
MDLFKASEFEKVVFVYLSTSSRVSPGMGQDRVTVRMSSTLSRSPTSSFVKGVCSLSVGAARTLEFRSLSLPHCGA